MLRRLQYTNGNILTSVYNWTLSTHLVYDYQYNDSSQLTSYDGNGLTYDGNGNLTSYNGSTYSWNGKNLSGIANTNHQITYQYNDNGIRTSKTVNGKTTTYTLDNKYHVASQTDGTNTMTFVYNMYNCPAAMTFNGTTYIYEKDAQGDVVGLFDSSNNEVVKYSYDSWGKLISISGSLADTLGKANPFRYRSYYYDTESKLYYLQSRYYNPEIGRFISKDGQASVSDQQDPISSNLYTYCNNDPINFIDPKGNSAVEFDKGLVCFLIDNAFTVSATQNGQFSDLFYFFGFYRDGKGVYHARQDCLQQYGGYNNFYDTVFNYFTSMTKMVSQFTYKGKDFRFWAWKGNYMNLGAGAELGIYSRLLSTDHWLAETEFAMPMTLTLKYKGKQIISYDPSRDDPKGQQKSKWWVTGFNPYQPYQGVIASHLTATYTIDFSGHKDMFTAFYNSKPDKRWKLNPTEYTAVLTF